MLLSNICLQFKGWVLGCFSVMPWVEHLSDTLPVSPPASLPVSMRHQEALILYSKVHNIEIHKCRKCIQNFAAHSAAICLEAKTIFWSEYRSDMILSWVFGLPHQFSVRLYPAFKFSLPLAGILEDLQGVHQVTDSGMDKNIFSFFPSWSSCPQIMQITFLGELHHKMPSLSSLQLYRHWKCSCTWLVRIWESSAKPVI